MLSLQGPKSKEILKMVSAAKFDNEAFPVSSNQWIEVAGHKVIQLFNIFIYNTLRFSNKDASAKFMCFCFKFRF